MAKTKIYKQHEVVFKTGDIADNMFIIRKGSVKVYFENNGSEVTLSILKEGAIFGEMAFFDNKTRSACVKIIEPCELTEITKDDFQKLVNQIPKWLVTIMQSLSQRLRGANEKLQQIEAAGSTGFGSQVKNTLGGMILPHQNYPYQHTLRALKILLLSLAKDGEKDEKDFCVKPQAPKLIWQDFFPEEADIFEKILDITIKTGYLSTKKNALNQSLLIFNNRGGFSHFVNTFAEMAKKIPVDNPLYYESLYGTINDFISFAEENLQLIMNVSVKNMLDHLKRKGKDTKILEKNLSGLEKIPEIKITHGVSDMIVRVNVKELKIILNYIKNIKIYGENNLA